MGISRRNTVILILISLLLVSCSGKKVLSTYSEKKVNQIVTKSSPYYMMQEESLSFDRNGKIKPINMESNKDGVKGSVVINDDVVKFVLERKDTLISRVDTTVSSDTKTDKTEYVDKKAKKSWWDRVKSKILLWSIIINLLFIAIYAIKTAWRIYSPIKL